MINRTFGKKLAIVAVWMAVFFPTPGNAGFDFCQAQLEDVDQQVLQYLRAIVDPLADFPEYLRVMSALRIKSKDSAESVLEKQDSDGHIHLESPRGPLNKFINRLEAERSIFELLGGSKATDDLTERRTRKQRAEVRAWADNVLARTGISRGEFVELSIDDNIPLISPLVSLLNKPMTAKKRASTLRLIFEFGLSKKQLWEETRFELKRLLALGPEVTPIEVWEVVTDMAKRSALIER